MFDNVVVMDCKVAEELIKKAQLSSKKVNRKIAWVAITVDILFVMLYLQEKRINALEEEIGEEKMKCDD
jgi:hypothetical protein